MTISENGKQGDLFLDNDIPGRIHYTRRIRGHTRHLVEATKWKCEGDVDNPNYLSPLGLKCVQHIGWDCKIFDSIGFSEEQKYELIENCPVSCQIPCGTYTKPPTIAPTAAPTVTKAPSIQPTPAPSENNCPDNPDFKTNLGLTCASVKRFDCTKFSAVGFSEIEIYQIINNCPTACNIQCGTWTISPSYSPTFAPSISQLPTPGPTTTPTSQPSNQPSKTPTEAPTNRPTSAPSKAPSDRPSLHPSAHPTKWPTTSPTASPSISMAPSETNGVQALQGGSNITGSEANPSGRRNIMYIAISASAAFLFLAIGILLLVRRKKSSEGKTKKNTAAKDSVQDGGASGGLTTMNQKRLMYDAMSNRSNDASLRKSRSRGNSIGSPSSASAARKLSIGSHKSLGMSVHGESYVHLSETDLSFLKIRPRKVKPFQAPQGTMLTENVVYVHIKKGNRKKPLKIFGVEAPTNSGEWASAMCFQE